MALMCTTETGIITYMSPKLQDMLGFHFTEIVGLYSPIIFLSPAGKSLVNFKLRSEFEC